MNRIQAGGGWAAIDRAFGDRPVLSSEQLMHPEKYERDERPVRVRVGDLRELLPQGARRLLRGDLGEFDSGQLLRAANGRARSERAAARLVGPGA